MMLVIKRLNTLVLFMLFLVMGSAPVGATEEKKQPIKKKERDIPTTRPRIPSNQIIYFSYDPIIGECYFTLPEGIGGIAVTLESEEGYLYYNYVAVENPVWPITLEQGEYHIICDADNGSTFEGDVWID